MLRVSQAVISGSDLHTYRGDESGALPANGRAMGHEGIGVIHKLGQGVTADAFVFLGRFADRYYVRRGCRLSKVPDDLADEMVGSVRSHR